MNDTERYDALLVEYRNVRDMIYVANQFLFDPGMDHGRLTGLLERMNEMERHFDSVPAQEPEPEMEVIKLRDTPIGVHGPIAGDRPKRRFRWLAKDGGWESFFTSLWTTEPMLIGPNISLRAWQAREEGGAQPIEKIVLFDDDAASAPLRVMCCFAGVVVDQPDSVTPSYTIRQTQYTTVFGWFDAS